MKEKKLKISNSTSPLQKMTYSHISHLLDGLSTEQRKETKVTNPIWPLPHMDEKIKARINQNK